MKKLIVVLMVTLMCMSNAFGVITADSTTWEGSYEAVDFPDIESGITRDYVPAGTCTVSGGLLNINSIDTNGYVVWGWATNSLTPSMDFSTGASFEIRFRVNAVDGDGGGEFQFADINGNNVRTELSPGGGGLWWRGTNNENCAAFTVPDPATFHTARFAITDLNLNGVSVFLDNNPVPTYVAQVVGSANNSSIWFGDPTGTYDMDWDIDYIRWTDAGAFPAPEPMTLALLGLGGLLIRRRK